MVCPRYTNRLKEVSKKPRHDCSMHKDEEACKEQIVDDIGSVSKCGKEKMDGAINVQVANSNIMLKGRFKSDVVSGSVPVVGGHVSPGVLEKVTESVNLSQYIL